MTDVKSKRPRQADETFETADRLHSAAITCCGGCGVRDRETGWPGAAIRVAVLVFGGPRSLGELADAEQVRPPTMRPHRRGPGKRWFGAARHATEDGGGCVLEASTKGTKILQEGRKRRVDRWRKQSRHYPRRAAETGSAYGPPPAGHRNL